MPIGAGDGQAGHDRPRCPQQVGEQLDGVTALLAGGAQHTGRDLPGAGTSPGTVAAPQLAAHDRRPDGPLRPQLVAGRGMVEGVNA